MWTWFGKARCELGIAPKARSPSATNRRPGVAARSSSRGGNIATWRHTFVLQCSTTRAASSTVGYRTPASQRWAAPSRRCSGWWLPVRARRQSRDSWSSLPPGWGSPLAVGCRSSGEVGSAPSRRTRCSVCWLLLRPRAGAFGTPWRGRGGETSTRWRSPQPELPSWSRRNAPRGALLYPRRSREELEGRFLDADETAARRGAAALHLWRVGWPGGYRGVAGAGLP